MNHTEREWLVEQYWDKWLSMSEVADEADVSLGTIQYWFNKLDVPRRSQSEGQRKVSEDEGLVEVTCEECEDVFGSYEPERSRFCSKDCYIEHQKKRVNLVCEQCGDSYEKPESLASQSRFCSDDCRIEWHKVTFRGENHPNWKGGYEPYYGPSWSEWRRKILKRDDYTCQECGQTNDSNHVHHIKPVREFDDPEEAHFDSNLVTLCISCHSEVEAREDYQRVT